MQNENQSQSLGVHHNIKPFRIPNLDQNQFQSKQVSLVGKINPSYQIKHFQ